VVKAQPLIKRRYRSLLYWCRCAYRKALRHLQMPLFCPGLHRRYRTAQSRGTATSLEIGHRMALISFSKASSATMTSLLHGTALGARTLIHRWLISPLCAAFLRDASPASSFRAKSTMMTTSTSLAPPCSKSPCHAIVHATYFNVLSLHLYITYILYWTSLTRPLLSPALSGMAHWISCKSDSCNSGAVRPTENRPNVVLLDGERTSTRVKTHVNRKSCQKDSQRSFSITFYCLCRSHSTTVFSPLGLACEYRDLGPTHPTGT